MRLINLFVYLYCKTNPNINPLKPTEMAKAKYFLTYSLNNGSVIVKEPIPFSSKRAAELAAKKAMNAHERKERNTSALKICDADGVVIAIGICDASRSLFYPVR